MTTVSMPNLVEAWGRIFYHCSALTEIDFPALSYISTATLFEDCPALTTVHFHSNIWAIFRYTFSSCPNLSSIYLHMSSRIDLRDFDVPNPGSQGNVASTLRFYVPSSLYSDYINYSDSDEVFLGRDFTSKQNYSEELASKIDSEVRRIIDKAYKQAEQMLKDHREELDRVANALLEMETLDQDQFEAIYSGSKTVADLQEEDSKKSAARKVVEDAEAKERAEKEARELKSAQESDPAAKRVAIMDRNGNVRRIVSNGKPLASEEKESVSQSPDAPAEPADVPEDKEDQK